MVHDLKLHTRTESLTARNSAPAEIQDRSYLPERRTGGSHVRGVEWRADPRPVAAQVRISSLIVASDGRLDECAALHKLGFPSFSVWIQSAR